MSEQRHGTQLSFDDTVACPSLNEVTFVVVDLETTGGNVSQDTITEIGAVKIRGGEVIGEFATLINPGTSIPQSVVSLTGITNLMVEDAPRIENVLPAFLEFCAGAVLVAHNAAFDTGFLKASCRRHELRWPKMSVLCTVRLARRVLSRDETPNHKLGTLAKVLRARTEPTHRALDDARTTVDVLHSLLERLGSLGVHTLDELLDHLPDVSAQQRAKRDLAAALPESPGVYLFRGPDEEVLYIGTASNLRRRVRQYFTAGERRARIKEMVGIAQRIDHIECAHPLEAEVRELRLLAAHQPRYNRRSTSPQRAWWITVTDEAFPRLSIVRTPRSGALGPFRSRASAATAVDTLHAATTLRRCTQRIPAREQNGRPCVLYELERCGAPCAGLQTTESYSLEVHSVQDLTAGRDDVLLHRSLDELERLADTERFEDAAERRDQIANLVRSLDRGQRLAALSNVPELIAARPDGSGGWHLAIVRHARLAAAGTAPRGVAPMPVVTALHAAAETVLPGTGPLLGASPEETSVIYRWLTTGGTRSVRCETGWAEPANAAGSWRAWLKLADESRTPYAGID